METITKEQKRLVELSTQGELGETLLRAFGGKMGCRYPNKDSEFCIVFDSKSGPPEIDEIEKAVKARYEELGYDVEVTNMSGVDMIEFNITYERRLDIIFLATISTNYPLSGVQNAVRVTTNMDK